MRVSRQQAAANRERVLDAASTLFRLRGLDAVSIADITGAAGLTHGGFYGQFASKEALAEEACARAVRASVQAVRDAAAAPPATAVDGGDPRADRRTSLQRVLDDYLSTHRRDDAAARCAVSALSADAGRSSAQMQEIFASGITDMAQVLGSVEKPQEPGAGAGDPDTPDYPLLAAMVGAMILSRAVQTSDPALSDRILTETRERLAEW